MLKEGSANNVGTVRRPLACVVDDPVALRVLVVDVSAREKMGQWSATRLSQGQTHP